MEICSVDSFMHTHFFARIHNFLLSLNVLESFAFDSMTTLKSFLKL